MLTAGALLQNRYRVVRRIGQGGMGAVYEALHEDLGQTVALKETFHTDDETLRQAFRREARLLAGLRHPALPRVTDYFGEGDGLYLVMEYVAGDDLAELLRRRGRAFPAGDVLAWAAQLLDALDYMHTRDPPVIHRDIKPSNIKVTNGGAVCLLDFGLAKGSTAATTLVSIQGGTLAYAPPEQLHQQGTDARSDLFSLAATLYHLLTGEIAPVATARLVEVGAGRPDPLRRAGELNPQIPPGVAEVLMLAMSLDRLRRPRGAAEMARVLREAWRPSAVVGDQTNASLTSTVIVSPPAAVGSAPEPAVATPAPEPHGADAGGQAWSLMRELPGSRKKPIRLVLFSPDGSLLAWMDEHDGVVKLWDVRAGTLRQKLTDCGRGYILSSIAFSPDGLVLAGGSYSGTVLSDVFTDEKRGHLKPHTVTVCVEAIAFSPDGERGVSGVSDGTLQLWDARSGELLRSISGHNKTVYAVAFSPDGRVLATGAGDTKIKLWDAKTGELLRELLWHDAAVVSVAFSPDMTLLASASTDSTLMLWDARTGEPTHTTELSCNVAPNAIAFSPDVKTVAVGQADGAIGVWSVRTGELLQQLNGHSGKVKSVAFSPDGDMLASGGEDMMVRLWKARTAPA